MIKTKELTKLFGEFKALDDVEMNVKKGSVYGIIGPNGAGKTTLIKSLLGIYKPDNGEITIEGKNVLKNFEFKQDIFYISDDVYFFWGYSVYETAKFYAGIYKDFDWERFENLKENFKIDINRKVDRLSKGMQKQVIFWIGLCVKPKIMILDEPIDGIDPVMRKNIWRIILQDVAEREMTVLISSHNLRELENVCDHVGIMHSGKLVLEKSLDDAKGSLHKIQVAFSGEFPDELRFRFDILNEESLGRVHMIIARGNKEVIEGKIKQFNPIICDFLPLSLEEVFIYELGGMGYEFNNIVL